MEAFILVLSSLISVLSPVNGVADKVIESNLRSRVQQVEVLKVRVDNAPNFNPIKGKVDRIRIAARGIFPAEGIRIDTFELETDPINISLADLRKRRYVLQSQAGIGVRLVIRQEDVVQALKSPTVLRSVQQLLRGLNRRKQLDTGASSKADATLAQSGLRENIDNIQQTLDGYRITNPDVKFLRSRRIQISADIQEVKTGETLKLAVETGIEILEGRRLQLLTPSVSINGQPVPPELVQNIAQNLSQQLNLEQVEKLLQVRARVFKVEFANNGLEIAAFVGLPAGFKL